MASGMISRVGNLTVALGAAAVAIIALHPGVVRGAETGDVPTAVLGIEAVDVPDAVATEVTEALRQKVAATKGYQLVQGKDLVEVKLVFSCADEAPACMSQVGKSLGATRLIFGGVKRAGSDSFSVTLKLLDVPRAAVESWTTETFPKKREEAGALRALAGRWLGKLTGRSMGAGSLQVRVNIPGAAVALDGHPVGVSGEQPLVLAEVTPGKHEVSVEKSGYSTSKQEFTLAAGQTLPLTVSLSALAPTVDGLMGPPAASPAPVDDESRRRDAGSIRGAARAGFWVALVGGLASGGLALKFGNDVLRINKDLDPYRRYDCMPPQVGTCNSRNEPAQPLDLREETAVAAKTDEGNRAQTLQWVFTFVGAAFGIAGGYLFYKGYLDSDAGSGKPGENHGLRIFPTANASSGGILAEFDF